MFRILAFVLVMLAGSGAVMAQGNSFLDAYIRGQQESRQNALLQLQQLQMLQQMQQQQAMQEQQQATRERQRQSNIEELQAKARKSLADTAKGNCVAMFLDNSASEELTRRGTTIGQVCGCIEQEMFAMLTLDLSGKILVAANESAGDNEKFLSSLNGQEWLKRNTAAYKACMGQTFKK